MKEPCVKRGNKGSIQVLDAKGMWYNDEFALKIREGGWGGLRW